MKGSFDMAVLSLASISPVYVCEGQYVVYPGILSSFEEWATHRSL